MTSNQKPESFKEWLKSVGQEDTSCLNMHFAEMCWNAASATKPVSGWQPITFDEKGTIGNTPAHEQEVIFIYGERMIVGVFLNDIRKSNYPDGEEYEGDYGFYDDDENFYEADSVSFWMPKLTSPKQESISKPHHDKDTARRYEDESRN